MRIVLIHRYFWPDTPPYAHILKELALTLGDAGHDVSVLTCQPSYNRSVVGAAPAVEWIAPRVRVRRWPVFADRRSAILKLVNLVLFCARLLVESMWIGRADVVMAASAPPIAVARVGSWFARRTGARFVYHKQDIYPEVAVTSGILRPGVLASLLRAVDAATERTADRVIVLSKDMADTVRSRGVQGRRIRVINNFDPWLLRQGYDDKVWFEAAHDRWRDGDALHVTFAGNLGRFQNLEIVIDAAARLRNDNRIVFDFFGDGSLRSYIEHRVLSQSLTNVHLHGYRPPTDIAEFLRTRADVGIVSLLPGVIRTAYPSKTMSYLRQGCPVLAVVERESELARAVVSASAGIQADPHDVDQVADAIRLLAAEPARLAGSRIAARKLYEEEFSARRQLRCWTDFFTAMERAT